MSFDALNRYSANHKPWDHVGNIIPDIEHSEGERPAVAYQVASWLPVIFYDKYYENWLVTMPGKAVALDPDGRLMPAEYGLTSASVTYTTSDVHAGTIDIATGLPVTTAKVVTLANLSGVKDVTWTLANAGVTAVTSGFMGRFGVPFVDATIKPAIGVAPYAYIKNAGGDGSNPSQYSQHNYNMQHAVAVLCDYVIRLPLVPAAVLSETIAKTVTNSALIFGTSHVHTRAYAISNATGRYDTSTGTVKVSATATVVAFALDHYPIAKQTLTTPLAMASTVAADDLSGILVNEVTSIAQVNSAGKYFVDYDFGVIFVYSSDGTTLPVALSGASGTVSLQYFPLDTAPSTLSSFACVHAGSLVPGELLKVGASSNLVAAAVTDGWQVLGQIIGVEKWPLDGLDRVKTAFNPPIGTSSLGSMGAGVAGSASANLGQMDRMPGSSTGGIPDLLTFAGGADTVLIINLISR